MTQPEIPDKKPVVQEIEPGRYAWCRCGKSDRQPFCDGSHAGTDFSPLVITIEETRRVAWCNCKHTGNEPWCDGTHSSL